jgi:prepilin peptidase CpaA
VELEAAFRLANLVVLFVTLTVAAFTDTTRKKVYNWTTYPALGLGLALGYLADGLGTLPSLAGPGVGLLDRLVGFAIGFGTFFLFNRAHEARAVGVGDVKLMGAIGALTGAWLTVWAMFWGSLVGAVIAVWGYTVMFASAAVLIVAGTAGFALLDRGRR